MLRCREGDLAVVLNGAYTGYVVVVGVYHGDIPVLDFNGMYTTAKDVWHVMGAGIPTVMHGLPVGIEDRKLQPIGPAPSVTKTETRKEVPA